MSPEQAAGDPARRPERHLSLGAVLYEMLAGEPPYTGYRPGIIARLITSRPTPLRVMRDTVPEWLAAAVDKSLAKIPADRYASAAEFASSLVTAPPAAAAPSRRWRFPALAGSVALGVALAVSGRMVVRPPAAREASAVRIDGRGAASRHQHPRLGPLPPGAGPGLHPGSQPDRCRGHPCGGSRSGRGPTRQWRGGALPPGRPPARPKPGRRPRGARQPGPGWYREVRWDLDLLSSESGDLIAQATATALPESLRAFTDTATRVPAPPDMASRPAACRRASTPR